MRQYAADRYAHIQSIAEAGFYLRPGHYSGGITEIELSAKLALSEANFKIAQDAMGRDLSRGRVHYDLIFAEAKMEWEVEKAGLLADLEKELADMEVAAAAAREAAERYIIEIGLRKLAIAAAKRLIEMQKMELKLQLADTETLTLEAELALIQEKVKTAQMKLEIIPYLEQLVGAEERLLAAEEGNIVHKEALAAARSALVEKKWQIIPYLQEKAAAQVQLSEALIADVAVQEEIMTAAIDRAISEKVKSARQREILEAQRALEALRLLLFQATANLDHTKRANRIAVVEKKAADMGVITTQEGALTQNMIALEGERSASNQDADTAITDADATASVAANTTRVDSESYTIREISSQRRDTDIQIAEISAMANITNRLLHILV